MGDCEEIRKIEGILTFAVIGACLTRPHFYYPVL